MRVPRLHCHVFQSVPGKVSRTASLDAAIHEIDPEADPGMARLLVRLREIIARRSGQEQTAAKDIAGEAMLPWWPDRGEGATPWRR